MAWPMTVSGTFGSILAFGRTPSAGGVFSVAGAVSTGSGISGRLSRMILAVAVLIPIAARPWRPTSLILPGSSSSAAWSFSMVFGPRPLTLPRCSNTVFAVCCWVMTESSTVGFWNCCCVVATQPS